MADPRDSWPAAVATIPLKASRTTPAAATLPNISLIVQPPVFANPYFAKNVKEKVRKSLRDHSDCPQPGLDQLRPARHRKIRAPQADPMPALRIQMQLCGNDSLLQ